MNYYLAKTEPNTYSIDDLQKDGQTTWDGVRNPGAVNAMKQMQPGDKVFIYHSGEKSIVGLAEVVGNSRPDPDDKRSWLVDLKYLETFPEPRITLQEIKDSHLFDDFVLVRQGRLSVMAVSTEFVGWHNRQ